MNQLKDIIEQIQCFLAEIIKKTSNKEYCVDSFPLPLCKNVRIKRCKLAQGKEYLGYNSSKDEYYYGFKVHLITTINLLTVRKKNSKNRIISITLTISGKLKERLLNPISETVA